MDDLYAKRTNDVKPDCTRAVLYAGKISVHDVYMAAKPAKKVVPRFKPSGFRPTFIKQWRLKKELTQEQLAERVSQYLAERGVSKGYTYASIGRLENGKIGYTQLVLEAIADAVGTDPASLIMRDPSDRSAIWALLDMAKPAERAEIEEHAEIVLRKARRAS